MSTCSHEGNLTEEFKSLGRRLSNWGKWGPHDRLGTLNYITPERPHARSLSFRRAAGTLPLPLSAGEGDRPPKPARAG